MKKILCLLVLGIFVQIVSAQNSDYIKLKEEEKNAARLFCDYCFQREKTFNVLRGKVILGFQGEPQEGVYVEIFEYHREEEKYIRVAGCRTTASGLFHFHELRKGSYKMILSKDGGFQVTEVF